jgi:hypothetical protein
MAFLALAQSIGRNKGVPIDRVAKRSKDCLICWFCEFVPELIVVPFARTIKMESITELISRNVWNGMEGWSDPLVRQAKNGS